MRDVMYEATKEIANSQIGLKPRKVLLRCSAFSESICLTAFRHFQVFSNSATGKKKKDEINVDSLDFTSKILHTAWHPRDNIIAVAATNNLFLFKECQDGSDQ